MKKMIMLFSLLIAFSCEDKSSDEDKDDDKKVSCDELESNMWAEYNKLVGEYNSSGVTQATCSSAKAAIEAVRPCSTSDPDFYNDLNDASTLVNSMCS